LGIFAGLVRIPFGIWPELTEAVYARGFFVGVRVVLDFTIGLLPVPLLYVLVLGVMSWGVVTVVRRKRNQTRPSWKMRIMNLGAILGGIVFLFLFMWGYNYQRVKVETQMGLKVKPLQAAEIRLAAERAAVWLEESRGKISQDTSALPDSLFPEDLSAVMRGELSRVLEQNGYPTPGRVRVKGIWPGGAMMRLGVAGIYIPFTGQGCIPADMPKVDRPFTLAHEMSHAMGFGG
jgi:hypothetical protein